MRIFISFRGQRVATDVDRNSTVTEVKDWVRDYFRLGPDDGAARGQAKKILTLIYAGADMKDGWVLMDVGIIPGSTLRVSLKEEVKPILYVFCAFNEETIQILEQILVSHMKVEDLRALVTRKTGIPVGVFRLVSQKGAQLYDHHTLDEYDIDEGDTIRMETWDGWNDLLNLALMGFTSAVMAQFDTEEIVQRYQMKVAMYIAAHFGHVDLAVSLLRQGIRADEAVGEHPLRQWCGAATHIDSLKPPIHEATEMGSLGVLRAMVNHNICTVLGRDGNNLTPLNIALRKKQKPCASFLLTKQWSRITYNTNYSIPLSILTKIRRWCDKAKARVILLQGQSKSSLKNSKRQVPKGALVGTEIQLDGFTPSKMMTKTKAVVKAEEEQRKKKKNILDFLNDDPSKESRVNPELYFKQLSAVDAMKLPKLSKWGKMLGKTSLGLKNASLAAGLRTPVDDRLENEAAQSSPSPLGQKRSRLVSNSNSERDEKVNLPPIRHNNLVTAAKISSSHHNLSTGNVPESGMSPPPKLPQPGVAKGFILQTGHRDSPGQQGALPRLETQMNDSRDGGTPTVQSEPIQRPNKKKSKRLKSANYVAKSRTTTDGVIPLPMISLESNPRPFITGNVSKNTLDLFERYRGKKSRDNAIQCLSVANAFKDKPWLQQVRVAMAIAAIGVKKAMLKQPHLFEEKHVQVSKSFSDQDSCSSRSGRQMAS